MRFAAGVSSLIFTPLFTFGLVDASGHFAAWKLMPVYTYRGFFAWVYAWLWNTWCDLYGLAPLSHDEEFARFFMRATLLGVPLIGFVLFWLAFGDRIGKQLWKPLLVLLVFATPVERFIASGFQSLGFDVPAAEAARSIVVLMLMIVSTKHFRLVPRKPEDTPPVSGPHPSTN